MLQRITLAFVILTVGGIIISCDTAGIKRLSDGRSNYGETKKLSGKSIIEGYIQDAATKKRIKGARVEIKNANMGVGYYLRETGADGFFKIDDFIPYIKYMVEVSADGYVTYTSTGAISEGTHTIALKPESVLTGMVTNRRGEPLKGVEVKLNSNIEEGDEEGEYITPKPKITATDGKGRYRFDKLPSGSYMATFSGPNFITETARLQNIKEGETFTLPMVMMRPATVSGIVTIEGIGTGAINVDVTISGSVTYSATTYQDGSFRFEDVKPGTYKMTVSHQGFYDLQPRVIRIAEGEKKERVDFAVRAKEPQVQVYAYRYTFSPGDTIEFNIRSLRLESLRVTIYKVPVDLLVRGGVDPDKLNPEEEGLKPVTSWDEPIKEFEPYEWRYQSLQVKTAMPTGGYCVEVKGAGRVISRKFFSLTTVGVVMKRSQDSIFAYVTNLVDNTPIADAKIAIFDTTPVQKKGKKKAAYKAPEKIEDLPVAVVLKGNTDAEGLYHKKLQSWKYLSAIVIAKDGSYALCNTGAPSSFEKEQKKYFIYTDRPVYRAGDTVHYKIIGKNRESRFMPIQGQKIYYKIRNWNMDRTIGEGESPLDEWGVTDGRIVLSREGNLGVHEIQVGPSEKNLYGRGKFYVEQYRKPEFTINVTPSKEYFINGDTAEFKVEAKYFFGAPLKNALVKYRFYETKLRETETSYWWEQDYGTGGSYNRIILEGEKYADNNGIAVLRLHAGNYPYDREITCEATVVDRSNVSISSSNKVRVGRGEYYIKIEPAQHFFSSGEKKPVNIRTLTHTGKPHSAKVKVELFRYIWKPWERVYVHDAKPLFSEQVSTDSRGVATVNLPKQFSFYGEFDLVVNGVDRKDNVITASRVIWIYSLEGASVASRFKNLELSANETELAKPGEITCLIKSCFTDTYVCVTLEGRDVYEKKVIKMTGNIMPVQFTIKPEYAPNLFVTATMQRKRALYTSSVGISLPVHDTALAISIKPDKDKYMPGEKASVLVKTVDSNGKPVRADLSLAAVDEAIFQIRYDHTPLMRDYFYTKISNWVLTSYSYPITMLAGASKDGAVKVREKFEDTAFWSARIRTDENGAARVNFTLPDNLTTWRLTARGHDRAGRMGEKKTTFLVTQDLIARIGKPRFMVEGDTLSLIGIVNSNTERGLKKVSTIFKADDRILEADEDISISLPAFGSARSYYPYKVPKDRKEVALQYSAQSTEDARDALKLMVPIERRGTPFKLYGIGDMAANRTVTITPLASTDDFTFVPESVTLSVSPSPIIQMLRATKYLSEYPYGCIEQTLNSFMPNLALNRMLRQKGYDRFINEKARKKLDDKVGTGIDRIQRYQNDDGTWGWWAGSRGNAFVTGYVLYSLRLAKEAGFNVDKAIVSRGLTAVQRFFSNPKLEEWDAVAYLMYINALWGGWDHEIYKKIIKVKEPSTYQTAYLVKTLSLARVNPKLTDEMRSDINSSVARLVGALVQSARKDGRGIYWESRVNDRWGWPGGDTEMTAHVLSALISSGDRSTVPAQVVRSLCKRSRGDAWNSTKETATVMIALCGYLEAMGGPAVTKGALRFSLDGRKIADVAYDLENPKVMDVLTSKVQLSGENNQTSFTITADGEAGSDVSFDVVIGGTLYFKDKGALSLMRPEERGIRSLSNGIAITRTFASITRVRDSRNNEYMVPQSLAGKKVIQIGDELLVKVKFQAQDDFQYLVLEDYLPSGFEVTKNNAYDEYAPFVHIERWDNRMVYFFTDLKKNDIYEVAYIVRAELPGKFMVKPSRMECMYEPSIQGWASPVVVDVDKK